MAVTERKRHALHEWVKRVGDEEVAETLMELLPPVGWADVATKRDLDHVRVEMRAGLAELGAGLEREMRGVEQEMRGVERAVRLQLYWVVGSIWTALGVALAALS